MSCLSGALEGPDEARVKHPTPRVWWTDPHERIVESLLVLDVDGTCEGTTSIHRIKHSSTVKCCVCDDIRLDLPFPAVDNLDNDILWFQGIFLAQVWFKVDDKGQTKLCLEGQELAQQTIWMRLWWDVSLRTLYALLTAWLVRE